MIHTLEADSIQLEFDGRSILSDIYLKAETGKITGLLGRNGAGKSCLMKIIYGSLKSEKSIRIDGYAQHEALKQTGLLRYLPNLILFRNHFRYKEYVKILRLTMIFSGIGFRALLQNIQLLQAVFPVANYGLLNCMLL